MKIVKLEVEVLAVTVTSDMEYPIKVMMVVNEEQVRDLHGTLRTTMAMIDQIDKEGQGA